MFDRGYFAMEIFFTQFFKILLARILINFRYQSTGTLITATILTTLTIAGRSTVSSCTNVVTDTFSKVTNDLFVCRMPSGPLCLPANVRLFYYLLTEIIRYLKLNVERNWFFQLWCAENRRFSLMRYSKVMLAERKITPLVIWSLINAFRATAYSGRRI